MLICSSARPAIALMLGLALGACSKPAVGDAAPKTAAAPALASSASSPAPAQAPPPLPNPLEVGSQDAKDDLYCSGMIYAKYAPGGDALSPTEEAVRMHGEGLGVAIAQAGADKLMAQGVARVTQIGDISDAYAAQANKDIKAGKPRLKLEDCIKRAEAVPMPQQ